MLPVAGDELLDGDEPGEMNQRATTTQTSTETRATTVITWTNIFFVRGRDVNRYN